MASNNDTEYAQTIANMLIEQLERGVAPWQKPWAGGEKFMPYNPISGTSYKGSNALYLMAMQERKGYSENRWMTYKQAEAVGGQVRKGEKSTKIRFWQWTTERDKLDDNGKPVIGPDGQPEREKVRLQRPWVRQFAVFNADQIDGLPPREHRPQISKVETVERAEKILANSGAKIIHKGGDRAFYSSSTDQITLPLPEQFSDTYNYYSTALHELGHWTGHHTRLDRELGNVFGSEKYAKEELRAEIASLMLADEIGVQNDPQHVEQHAAYVGSWIKALKDDPTEILRAASDATKITRYVMGLEQQQEQEIQQEQNEQQGHYSDRTMQALIDRHGWTPTDPDRPLDNVGKVYEGVGPNGMIAPNGERRLIAGYNADRERRRYVAVALGDNTIADFDGREAAPEEVAARLDLAAATYADEQRVKRGHEPRYVEEASRGQTGGGQTAQLTPQELATMLAGQMGASDALTNQAAFIAESLTRVPDAPTDNKSLAQAVSNLMSEGHSVDWFSDWSDDADARSRGAMKRREFAEKLKTFAEVDDQHAALAAVIKHLTTPKSNGEREEVPDDLPADIRSVLDEASQLTPIARQQYERVVALGPATATGSNMAEQSSLGADLASAVWEECTRGKDVAAPFWFVPADQREHPLAKEVTPEQPMTEALKDVLAQSIGQANSAAYLPNTRDEPTPLDAQFRDKEAVKELGAKWDKAAKKWMVPAGVDLTPFAAWLPNKAETASQTMQPDTNEAVGGPPTETVQPMLAAEKTYLSVPYREKGEAKALGAKWDKEAKSWYAPVGADLNKFEKFMPKPVTAAVELAGNAQAQFGEAMRDAGLMVDDNPIMDGKIHRVQAQGDKGRERSGAYCGYLDGRPGGWYQNYKTGEKTNWKADVGTKLSAEERASMLAQAAQQRQAREQERMAGYNTVAKAAQGIVSTLVPVAPENAYVAKKGISPVGLLQASDATVAAANEQLGQDKHSIAAGDLIVPMQDASGEIRSVQVIKPNGWKGFLPGGQVSGSFTMFGEAQNGPDKRVWVAEGMATAASIHQATGEPVAVAFNAANLKAVAEQIRQQNPDAQMLIAGDDDRHLPHKSPPQPNVGVEKAGEAAAAVNGLAILPTFGPELDGVDWNDIAQKEGLGGLTRELNETVTEAQKREDERRKEEGRKRETGAERTEEREDVLTDAISSFRNLDTGIGGQNAKTEQAQPEQAPAQTATHQQETTTTQVKAKTMTRPGLRIGGRR